MKTHALIFLPLLLAGCGDSPSEGTTTTKLDAVEVQPGTISDAMIILDDSSIDGTAVDNSIPVDPNAKDKSEEETEQVDGETKDDAEGESAVTLDGAVGKAAEPAKK